MRKSEEEIEIDELEAVDDVETLCRQYMDKYESLFLSRPKVQTNKTRDIISISDLHAPFSRWDLAKQIVKKHSGAYMLVLNGDLFDSYLLSKFRKMKYIPFLLIQQLLNHTYLSHL